MCKIEYYLLHHMVTITWWLLHAVPQNDLYLLYPIVISKHHGLKVEVPLDVFHSAHDPITQLLALCVVPWGGNHKLWHSGCHQHIVLLVKQHQGTSSDARANVCMLVPSGAHKVALEQHHSTPCISNEFYGIPINEILPPQMP